MIQHYRNFYVKPVSCSIEQHVEVDAGIMSQRVLWVHIQD